MNILILNWRDPRNPNAGGAEIVTMEHAKAWNKAGYGVTWFTSSFQNAREKEKIEGIDFVRKGNFITVFLYAFFYYLFSGKKFDLVIDQIHGIPFLTPFYVRKPKIAFIHEVANDIWDYMYPFPINKLGKAFEKVIFIPYRHVKFMTVSNSTANELKLLGIKRISIITNGLRITKIEDFKKEEKPTFIFVSRVVKMKGVEDVIRSFFYIIKELKDAQLWIVGDGDKKYMKFLFSEMNLYAISTKVKFFGKVTERKKLELMKRANILLHASVKEGWGLVVVESASQETPSIVYNVPGLRDSVINNKTGIVLKKNLPSEMAKEAISLIRDEKKYKSFQDECIKWARSLSWEKSTQESLSLIEETLSK